MEDSVYDEREQSEIKHFVLGKYLEAATRILGPSKTFRYVDCCAGPWKSRMQNFSDTSFGIALREFESARDALEERGLQAKFSCLLIEKRKPAFSDLSTFVEAYEQKTIKIQVRNWDFAARISDIVKFSSTPGGFSFIFIDPTGWKLAGFPTITELLRVSPGEVLINFMSSFVTRFIKAKDTGLNDVLGGDTSHLAHLAGAELEFGIVQHYCDQIRKIGGYKYVCSLPVMKPKSEAINFYLIYATRHPKGVEVFKSVERRTEEKTRVIRSEVQRKDRQARTGLMDLFHSSEYYREDRYAALTSSNKERARNAVTKLIMNKGNVGYHECWAEALQYAAVFEKDLRHWLAELESARQIEIKGRRTPHELLKRGALHRILWSTD